jgi:hypothetical protein
MFWLIVREHTQRSTEVYLTLSKVKVKCTIFESKLQYFRMQWPIMYKIDNMKRTERSQ